VLSIGHLIANCPYKN
jgi:hypothetical protein